MSQVFVVPEYSIFIYHVSSSMVRGHLNEDHKTSSKIKRKPCPVWIYNND